MLDAQPNPEESALNRPEQPDSPAAAAAGGTQVRCRDRLGGLLRYYHRAA